MNAYPDASFLVSLYVKRTNSAAAAAHMTTMHEPLHVGSLLRVETANAIRREAYRKNITEGTATAALAAWEADIDSGVIVIPTVEWEAVHAEAERLSNAHGLRHGFRTFDVLHVATALILRANVLLTFDSDQARLAKAEGLKVMP